MDQGQASINYFYWVNAQDEHYVNRRPWNLQYIDRECDYDVNSLLQTVRSAYTHTPSSRLLQTTPGSFNIPKEREVWEPFEYTVNIDDWVQSHKEVFNRNDFQPNLNEVTTPLNFDVLTLWASDKSSQMYVRQNPSFKMYKEIILRQPSNLNHRGMVLYKGLHTLMQYNPPLYGKSAAALALNTYPQNVLRFRSETISIYRSVLQKYTNVIGGLEMLSKKYENDLNTVSTRARRVSKHYSILKAIIQSQQFVPIFRNNAGGRDFAVFLWLFSPHAATDREVNEDGEFCLAYLSLYVLEKRFLSISEWTMRKNQGVNQLSHTQSLHGQNNVGSSGLVNSEIVRLKNNLTKIRNKIPGSGSVLDPIIAAITDTSSLLGVFEMINNATKVLPSITGLQGVLDRLNQGGEYVEEALLEGLNIVNTGLESIL